MAEITRPNLNVKAFAAEAQSGERTVFGDTTVTDDLTQNLSADYERGWGIVSGNDLPTKQDFNGAMFSQSALTAYLFQHGVSEWNSKQEYFHPAIVFGSDGNLYASVKDSTGENPTTDDGTNWKSALEERFGGALLQGGFQGTTKNFVPHTDLDEYIEGGWWGFLASYDNTPEAFDGTVLVAVNARTNRITQLALSQGSTRVFTATRNSFDNGATWTDWTRLSTSDDIEFIRGTSGRWETLVADKAWRLPNGLIVQMDRQTVNGDSEASYTLPVAFPNFFIDMVVSSHNSNPLDVNATSSYGRPVNLSTVRLGNAWGTATPVAYIAIGR